MACSCCHVEHVEPLEFDMIANVIVTGLDTREDLVVAALSV